MKTVTGVFITNLAYGRDAGTFGLLLAVRWIVLSRCVAVYVRKNPDGSLGRSFQDQLSNVYTSGPSPSLITRRMYMALIWISSTVLPFELLSFSQQRYQGASGYVLINIILELMSISTFRQLARFF